MAGEREGFSLVELIIVIAIMAILIGVIALAVIPNIQRSRESKDLTTLDNVLASTNIAIANNQISSAGSFVVGGAVISGGTEATTVKNAVETELGTNISLASSQVSGRKVVVSWTASSSSSAAIVTVSASDSGGTAAADVAAAYTEAGTGEFADSNGKRLFKVSSQAASGS